MIFIEPDITYSNWITLIGYNVKYDYISLLHSTIAHCPPVTFPCGQTSGYILHCHLELQEREYLMQHKYSKVVCKLTLSMRHAGKIIHFSEL